MDMGQSTIHFDQAKWLEKLKRGTSLLLIGGLGLLATGCGSTTTTPPPKPLVRIWRLNQDIDTLKGAISDFHRANPNVQVTYKKKSLENYEFSTLKSLSARRGPDIWSIPSDWLGDYFDTISALPADYFFAAQQKTGPTPAAAVKLLFPPGIAKAITSPSGKKVYGIPTNVDSLQLYFNPDVAGQAYAEFKKAHEKELKDSELKAIQQLIVNPPKTWDGLVSQSKYLTVRNGSTITRSSIAIGTSNNIPDSEDILQLLMLQNGASIINSDHNRVIFQDTISTPSGGTVRPGEKALEFFTSFSNPGKDNYSWNPSMPQALDAFGQGKVAMVIAYTDFAKQLRIKYPKLKPEVYAVPQISVGPSSVPVNYIRFSLETVTLAADNPAAAFSFLKSYTNEGTAGGLAGEQGLTTPYLASLKKKLDNFKNIQTLYGQTTYKPYHTQFDTMFRQMIYDVSQNGIAPDQALDNAAESFNKLLTNPPK